MSHLQLVLVFEISMKSYFRRELMKICNFASAKEKTIKKLDMYFFSLNGHDCDR